jgi:hypothetical protein
MIQKIFLIMLYSASLFLSARRKRKPADLLAEYHNYKVGSLNKNFKPIPS